MAAPVQSETPCLCAVNSVRMHLNCTQVQGAVVLCLLYWPSRAMSIVVSAGKDTCPTEHAAAAASTHRCWYNHS